ncbi:hypothetical protein Syun_012729 [Stephania yunnanensis]|uniref:Uncharacterized protein n=1 Tax=Stephania yunnanensis TaxID=152371 RepID=A0AAP0K0R4_9MAGN
MRLRHQGPAAAQWTSDNGSWTRNCNDADGRAGRQWRRSAAARQRRRGSDAGSETAAQLRGRPGSGYAKAAEGGVISRRGGGAALAATSASDSGNAGKGQAAPASGSDGATVVSAVAR